MATKDFSFRIDDDLLRKLHYVAKYNDRSVNRELTRLVRLHIAKFEQEHGEIQGDL